MNSDDLPPELRAHLAELPEEIGPARDLWADIETAIQQPAPQVQEPVRFGWRRQVAAAVCIALASSALTMAWQRPPDIEPASTTTEHAVVADWEQDLRATNAALLAELEARSGEIDPALLVVVRENLAAIDVAIEQVRLALETDPNNADLAENLAYVYQRKLDLLRQASHYPG